MLPPPGNLLVVKSVALTPEQLRRLSWHPTASPVYAFAGDVCRFQHVRKLKLEAISF